MTMTHPSAFLRCSLMVTVGCTLLFAQSAFSAGRNSDSLAAVASGKLPGDRFAAVRALGNIKDPDRSVIAALIARLTDDDPYLIGESARALGRIGKPAVIALTAALRDTSVLLRNGAAIALGKIGPEAYAAAPVLAEAVQQQSGLLRWYALIALGNIGPAARSAAPSLEPLLRDADEDTRWGAVYALRQIDPPRLMKRPERVETVRRIETFVPQMMKRYNIPGVAVTLFDSGRIVWRGQFGTADIRTNEPVTSATMFEACSMTKPVFAYLVMKLAQQGRIDLDRPLSAYLQESYPQLGPSTKPLTARMVLNHTSGMPNWRIGGEEADGPLPLYAAPGSRFGYSGEAMFALQRVVERITGEPLDTFAGRTLFRPLGLKNIGFGWSEEFDRRIAAGHDTAGAFRMKTRYQHPNAAYSMYVSADDYAAFLAAVTLPSSANAALLDPAHFSEMLHPVTPVTTRDAVARPGRAHGLAVQWGLGWAVDSTLSGPIHYHSGANSSGFRCYSQFRTAERSGIVIMTNGMNGSEFWRALLSRIGDL